jgi:L-ascorbate metabolism protein UlaG (beta-lactamase superfamily)
MRIRWLGWAGVEIEAEGDRIVIDPLDDPAAVFAPLGERAAGMTVPDIVPAQEGAAAGFVTHLHRDHADAGALAKALAEGSPLYEPQPYGGSDIEQAAVAAADRELAASGLRRVPTQPWSTVTAGPFSVTALPAVDGTGDPQVSWLVQANGRGVLHLGDTMFHGWWWRIAERFGPPDAVLAPINGARLTFPNRRPASSLPAMMEPEQAALAAELLRAEQLVPIHYGAYALDGIYEPVPDALDRVTAASTRTRPMRLGETIDI